MKLVLDIKSAEEMKAIEALLKSLQVNFFWEESTRKQKAKDALAQLQGIGTGVWENDAQLYINNLRDDERQ